MSSSSPTEVARYILVVDAPDFDFEDLDADDPVPAEAAEQVEAGLTAVVANLSEKFPALRFTFMEAR